MPCIAIAQPASAAHLPPAPSLRRRVRGLAIFLMMLEQHPGAGAMVVGARQPAQLMALAFAGVPLAMSVGWPVAVLLILRTRPMRAYYRPDVM